MAANRFVLSLAVAVSGSIMLQSAVSAQESQGTEAQRMACTPDVFRLCGAQIPDHDRIVSCLRQNIALLSRPCRAVFEPNSANSQQGVPQPQPRGRAMQQPSYGMERSNPISATSPIKMTTMMRTNSATDAQAGRRAKLTVRADARRRRPIRRRSVRPSATA